MDFLLRVTTVCALVMLVHAQTGMMCSEHPLAPTEKKGVLIRSWSYAPREDGHMNWPQSVYLPRYTQHSWVPVGDDASNKYLGLDYFTSHSSSVPEKNFCTLNFQRMAKIYLLVSGYERGDPEATLTGWKSEGWVEFKERASQENNTVFGLGSRKGEMYAPSRAYVFSKVAQSVTIPSHHVLATYIKGIKVEGYWKALIGEADGSAFIPPESPLGVSIPPGGRCPDELHDAWMTPATDAADEFTTGKMFHTFHPLWDPCYWCAYDHEHGSDPKSLMGYSPKYGYTALKNGNEDESHKGFKGIVMDVDDKLVYYGIHAHMSKGHRFGTRHHTKVIAVVDKITKKLEVELSFKADYGHREVRLAEGNDRLPLSSEDEALRDAISSGSQPRKQRLINVIDPKNYDTRLLYRTPPDQLHGEYEQWSTHPICSTVKRWGEPTVDFKDMGLALRTTSSAPSDVTVLGRIIDDDFIQQPSTNREFRSEDFEISDKYCIFPLPDINGKPDANGKFYTDPYGNVLLGGPGPEACAQLVHPGFNLKITGRYETMDTWYGMYTKGSSGSMKNVGYGIDENEN